MKESPNALQGKKVSESRTSMNELVLPNDANTRGTILGGKVMHWMDLVGAIAAYRHCRKAVVTVSVDSLRFLHPVKIGELMLLDAVVTRAFRTSMEVLVEVRSENLLTGERRKTCSGFLSFVAVDEEGQPTSVPPLVPENSEERSRFEAAQARRERRLQESTLG